MSLTAVAAEAPGGVDEQQGLQLERQRAEARSEAELAEWEKERRRADQQRLGQDEKQRRQAREQALIEAARARQRALEQSLREAAPEPR